MKEDEFGRWLETRGYHRETVREQIDCARRLEDAFGDLDRHLDDHGLEKLEQKLAYSREDQRAGKPNPAPLYAGRNIYGNMSSYRSTLNYYRKFSSASPRGPSDREDQSGMLARLGRAEIEATMDDCDAIGLDAFLKEFNFGRPLIYWVKRSGSDKIYPVKATVAIAVGKLSGGYALRRREFFRGYGEQRAVNRLRDLGYEIVRS